MIINEYPAHIITESAKQGYWGEMYVKSLYEKQGYIVAMNPDQFGGWDMIKIERVTGRSYTVQVKTLVRYVTKNYFGIKDGVMGQTIENLKYCDELVLVVRNPHSIDDHQYKGKVLRVIRHRDYKMRGLEYIIPSNSENFELLGVLSLVELNQVSSYGTSIGYTGSGKTNTK